MTDAVQQPRQPTPAGNPLQGGSRRYVVTVPILRNRAGTGTYTINTSYFRIWHPSVRLHVCMTLGFRPDTGAEDATIPAGWTVTMDAWSKSDRESGGFPIRGNQVIPGPFALPNALPLSYETVTGVDEWRGVVTVPIGATGTGLAVNGTLYLNVMWEPAAGESPISDKELESIFKSCKVQPGTGATVFQSP